MKFAVFPLLVALAAIEQSPSPPVSQPCGPTIQRCAEPAPPPAPAPVDKPVDKPVEPK